MSIRVTSVLVALMVVAVVAAAGSAPTRRLARAGACGSVAPDVLQALQTNSEVSVIVSLKSQAGAGGVGVSAMQSATAAAQAAVLADVSGAQFTTTMRYKVMPALAGMLTADGASTLGCHPNVDRIDLNRTVHADLNTSVPFIHADQVQTVGFDGTGINVAVLDTGIDTDHPDLVDSIIGQACSPSPSLSWVCPSGNVAEDDNGHGTHVSGIITSDGGHGIAPVGVAPGANIFAWKVLGPDGFGDFEGIGNALDDILLYYPGVFQFINMSLGDGGNYTQDECNTLLPAFRTAIYVLRLSLKTLTFAAAGNDGFKSGLGFPACIKEVVSVGAVYDNLLLPVGFWPTCLDALETGRPANPDTVACGSNSSQDLDLVAPGYDVESDWLGATVNYEDGTSMASPHAVGVAALLKQALPKLSTDQIEATLKRTAASALDYLNDEDPATNRISKRVDARAAVLDDDFDGDGCPNGKELQAAAGSQMSGGLRDPENPWDYFNPTHDHQNRVDDILKVVGQYFHDDTDGNPGLPPYAPGYNVDTDRTPHGPNVWNLGAPNGQQRVDDILAMIGQYFHDC